MAYKFDLDFQKHILAAVVKDKKFLRYNYGIVKPEHFGDEIYAGIAECAFDFWKKHKETPRREVLLKEIKERTAPGRKYHEYADAINEIYAIKKKNTEYFQDQALDFARSQAVQGVLRASVSKMEQGQIDEIGRMFKKAIQTGRVRQGLYDFFEKAGERVKAYLNGSTRGHCVATGLSFLDDAMGGGLGKGELGVYVALPGYGKTTMLVNTGARALLQNKKVLHFTLELSRKIIASKYDTCLFGMSTEKIRKAPKHFARSLRGLRDRLTGSLHIAEFPTDSMTVDQLEAESEKIEGLDLILIDYGQLVKSSLQREKVYHELTEVYKGLRRIAGELKVPIWTAHQANRPGTGADIIRMEHIAGDFNVAAISDICVSINHDEEEKREGKLRLFIMKSRIGPSGLQINCAINWKTARVRQN